MTKNECYREIEKELNEYETKAQAKNKLLKALETTRVSGTLNPKGLSQNAQSQRDIKRELANLGAGAKDNIKAILNRYKDENFDAEKITPKLLDKDLVATLNSGIVFTPAELMQLYNDCAIYPASRYTNQRVIRDYIKTSGLEESMTGEERAYFLPEEDKRADFERNEKGLYSTWVMGGEKNDHSIAVGSALGLYRELLGVKEE